MAIAGKIYKQYNTPASLAELTEFKLRAAGVEDKDDRKLLLAAVRKAGYRSTPATPSRAAAAARETSADAGPSSNSSRPDMSGTTRGGAEPSTSGAKRKRKRDEGRNEFLPDRPRDELDEQTVGSLAFNEVLDEEALQSKFVVINRAPIMMAWASVVAERLGFQREEALSIASVYTEMNAISKGVSIGLYDAAKQKGVEASRGGSQPYVDLMGRRPLYQTASGRWRALAGGSPVAPASAFSYISRALRQTAPSVLGALRLLAASFAPDELNRRGFYLYADFRPDVAGWGGRGEVRCAKILALRRKEPLPAQEQSVKVEDVVKVEEVDATDRPEEGGTADEPEPKRSRGMTLEEYEAALDADDVFASVDLDLVDPQPKREDGD
ncbi:hypothetical protein PsYK624_002860 [Phanerochaete sordida]|uniref:Uncharacterized protein n=1 Tax=Phanerochaete sordida TaxID=48140 RepID=A0A9P3FXU0_9APHY|nr:hypothetical protein PsYK624_002860 [Phanerochaete sordida]